MVADGLPEPVESLTSWDDSLWVASPFDEEIWRVDGDVSVEFDGVRVAYEKVRPARAWGWSMQCVNTTGRTPHCAGQVRCHNGSDFTVE